jgi:hypothetical protein
MEQKWHDFTQHIGLFFLGALWAAISGLGPAVVIVYGALQGGVRIDWNQVMQVALAGASLGVAGFWRKNKALLEMPPGIIPTTKQKVQMQDIAAPPPVEGA